MQIKSGNSNGFFSGPNAVWKLIGLFVLVNIVLIGALGLIAVFEWKPAYLKFVGVRTNGVIVDFKYSVGTEAGAAPVVEYNVNGQTYTVIGTYSDQQTSELGSHLAVIYAPSDPNTAQVDEDQIGFNELLAAGGAILLALVVTDFALIVLIITRIFMRRALKVTA